MRATVQIKEDLLEIAKTISSERAIGLDQVIDELIRRGIDQTRVIQYRNGLPTVQVAAGTKTVTRDDVARLMDEE